MEKSETVKELFLALSSFREQLKQPLKDAENPFFKKSYVPLENVVETLDEEIKGTGLSYLQEIESNRVNTVITHKSGEYLIIGGSEVKPVKQDPQALGSAITYAKRYSLCCAFGITSDEDDDVNEASKSSEAVKSSKKESTKQLSAKEEKANEQLERALKKANELKAPMEKILEWNKLQKVEAIKQIAAWIKEKQ